MITRTPEKFSWPFLNLLDNFISNMFFLNSKGMESEYFLKKDVTNSRNLLFYRFEAKQRCWKDSKKVYFGFRKIPCGLFPKDIFSVFGRLIEDYLRNLTRRNNLRIYKIPDISTFLGPTLKHLSLMHRASVYDRL
jgi:hypothetical protein